MGDDSLCFAGNLPGRAASCEHFDGRWNAELKQQLLNSVFHAPYLNYVYPRQNLNPVATFAGSRIHQGLVRKRMRKCERGSRAAERGA